MASSHLKCRKVCAEGTHVATFEATARVAVSSTCRLCKACGDSLFACLWQPCVEVIGEASADHVGRLEKVSATKMLDVAGTSRAFFLSLSIASVSRTAGVYRACQLSRGFLLIGNSNNNRAAG
eukprot:1712529-Amphidinium_carterae.1